MTNINMNIINNNIHTLVYYGYDQIYSYNVDYILHLSYMQLNARLAFEHNAAPVVAEEIRNDECP
jgi:hypothetical protein